MKARSVFAVVLPIFGIFGVFAYAWYDLMTSYKTVEHVEQVSWLPEAASDISYFSSYAHNAGEFDISEEGFLQWAKRWSVEAIDEPVEVLRYSYFTWDPPDTDANDWAECNRLHAEHVAEIADGYFHQDEPTYRGGVTVAYDRTTGRAYYMVSIR